MIKLSISYNRLWKLLIDKKMSKAELRRAAEISPNTMTKLAMTKMYQWLFLREFVSISVATSVTSAILCKRKYRVRMKINFVFSCCCI